LKKGYPIDFMFQTLKGSLQTSACVVYHFVSVGFKPSKDRYKQQKK